MKIVGAHLEQQAKKAGCFNDKDLFGRSAFNRFYYAMFLTIREELKTYSYDPSKLRHASVPEAVKNGVVKKITKHIKKLRKKELLSYSEAMKIESSVKKAGNDLHNLLEYARDIRNTADYHPEEIVKINGHSIELKGCKISEAQNWENDARKLINIISKHYRYVGLS